MDHPKLDFKPDEYLCTWHVPDGKGGIANLPGNIQLLPQRLPFGNLYGDIPLIKADDGMVHLPQVDRRVAVVTATLATGGTVLLTDATITYFSSHGDLYGSAALIRLESGMFRYWSTPESLPEAAPTFSALRIQVSALDALGGIQPLGRAEFPAAESGHAWTVPANVAPELAWTSDAGNRFAIRYSEHGRTGDAYSFSIGHSPVADVEVQRPSDLPKLLRDWVEPLRAIASISTGRSESVTAVMLPIRTAERKPMARDRYQVFGPAITQEPYYSSEVEVRRSASVIQCGPDGVNLLGMIERWQALSAEHHPLVETYGAMLHTEDQHPRSRFLLLLQAIEGMHGHDTRLQWDTTVAEHGRKRQAVLDVAKGHLRGSDREFLRKFLAKRPHRTLETALRSVLETLPVDMTSRLATTRIVQNMGTTEGPLSSLRQVRNHLAHGTKGYKVHQLDEVVTILECVVRAHALRLLGCGDVVVERVLTKR